MLPRRRLAAVAALALTGVSISPVAAHADSASTYYVSVTAPACTDLGPGTQAEPFCTVQHAATAATVPGDTVMIEPGIYSGEVDITSSGTAAAPITFEPTTPPIPDLGRYSVTLGALVFKGASYIDVTGVAGDDVQVSNSSHVTVGQGQFGPGASASVPAVQVTGTSSDTTISKLSIYGPNTGSAILIDASGTGNAVTTSLVTDGASSGITVDGSAGAILTGNTVYGYCGTGIAIGDDSNGTASGAVIENNVIAEAYTSANPSAHSYCHAPSAVGLSVQSAADAAGMTSDYNSVFPDLSTSSEVYSWAGTAYSTPAALQAATTQGAHDSVADPVLWADGAIRSEASPLVDSANAGAPDEQSTDVFGNARVADPNVAETGAGTAGYDRGAIQFVEVLGMGTPSTPATAPSGAPVTVTASAADSNWANATFTYDYDFGDGTKTSSPSLTASHTYTAPGTYTVNVTAVSGNGAMSTSSTSIRILAPVTFAANLTLTPTYGTRVDASVSISTDWPVTSATLNFGDGKPSQTVSLQANGSTASGDLSYDFYQPGTYPVSLTIADAGGDTATVTQSVTTKGTEFTPYGPTRLLDTRTNFGGTSNQLLHDGSIKLKIAGTGTIPSNVTAVALNLTVVNAGGGGFIQADTGTDTKTSTVNYNPGGVYDNAVIASVASDGTVTLRNFGGTTSVKVDLIADVTGYFAPSVASAYNYVTPTRLMDTRKGLGTAKARLTAGKTDVLTVEGVSPLPASGVTAVTVNITEVATTGTGYLLAYPDGAKLPNSSTVDWAGSTTKAASAIVPMGADGKIDIYDGGAGNASADVIVDVTGYFTNTGTGDVYVPVPQLRVFDTRKFVGTAPGTSSSVDLSGQDGTPPQFDGWAQYNTIVDGYVLNATVTQTPSNGYLQVSGSSIPNSTSTVNWTGANQTTANLAFTQAGRVSASDNYDYYVWFYNGATTGRVQVIADVMGYFAQISSVTARRRMARKAYGLPGHSFIFTPVDSS